MENIESLYHIFEQNPTICTDTRKITPSCLFFCLKGENFDGNTFAERALEAGAACVVTENNSLAGQKGFFVVENVLETLQALATYHRKQFSIPFIGITGTNGKTTTKELVSTVLATKYKVSFTQGNFNNHIGVPLTILSIPKDTEIAIIEMGANHVGEIADLCKISQPNYGVITNIGTAHIEGFGSKENIIQTKTALYRSVIANNGQLFVNATDPILTQYVKDYAKVVYYGDAQSACNGVVTDMNPYLQIKVSKEEFHTHLTGEYNLTNILCAITVGQYFGIGLADACCAVANYQPQNNRSQIVECGSNTIIADYYNANPTSMTAALNNMSHLKHQHKVAVLGDMLELGTVSDTEHQQIIALCKLLNLDAYFVGNNFCKFRDDSQRFFKDVEELNCYLQENPIQNAMILIKGSRGIHLEKCAINN